MYVWWMLHERHWNPTWSNKGGDVNVGGPCCQNQRGGASPATSYRFIQWYSKHQWWKTRLKPWCPEPWTFPESHRSCQGSLFKALACGSFGSSADRFCDSACSSRGTGSRPQLSSATSKASSLGRFKAEGRPDPPSDPLLLAFPFPLAPPLVPPLAPLVCPAVGGAFADGASSAAGASATGAAEGTADGAAAGASASEAATWASQTKRCNLANRKVKRQLP